MLYGEEPKEVPSLNFIHECRVVVEVIGETIAALSLQQQSHGSKFGWVVHQGDRFHLQH